MESGAGQEAINAVNRVMRSFDEFAAEEGRLKTRVDLQQEALGALAL